jgi:glutaredoxin 1
MERFTVFGRQSCSYCRLAKELLNKKSYDLRWVDIEQEGISKADLEKTVGKPVLTVPQIFHGQTYVGGYTELNEYIKTLEAVQTN